MVLPPHVPVPDYSYAPYSPYPIAGVPFEKSGNEKKRQASPLPPVLPVPHGDLRQPWLHQSAFDPRNMPPIPGPRNFARPPYMGPGFPGSAYYMPVPPPPGALRGPYHPHFASYPLNRGPPVSPPAHIDLGGRIIRQIEFYFSDENLPTDYYLISLMDKHGWVPITKVADFRRIKAMTTEIPFILYALQFSSLIEVQGDKIRRRDQWSKWVPASKRQNPEEKIGNNGEEDPSKHDSCRDLSVKPSEDSSLEGAESSAISPDGSENLESSLDKERKPDDLASDFSNKFTL
ncbi:PREDICTED: la-related protein 1A-like [Tarenaya hassleriana]|uniref:la-related protein 1A-like n=1 Tax=Tarenaya hassleriana TaxID=28532 RepID=UPI00053C2208|nr:PREDICTED: la-related protein 1A-like [Tarenaya hassleriana]